MKEFLKSRSVETSPHTKDKILEYEGFSINSQAPMSISPTNPEPSFGNLSPMNVSGLSQLNYKNRMTEILGLNTQLRFENESLRQAVQENLLQLNELGRENIGLNGKIEDMVYIYIYIYILGSTNQRVGGK